MFWKDLFDFNVSDLVFFSSQISRHKSDFLLHTLLSKRKAAFWGMKEFVLKRVFKF